jgi:hypothetical protein
LKKAEDENDEDEFWGMEVSNSSQELQNIPAGSQTPHPPSPNSLHPPSNILPPSSSLMDRENQENFDNE